MAYLLELLQQEQRCVVGMFGSEAEVLAMVELLPARHEDPERPGVVWLESTELPELTEIDYRGWVFPLSRSAFSTYPSDGVIHVVWTEVQNFDETPPTAGVYCAGSMPVNGYTFGMADGVAHVHARERLFAEAEKHFRDRGLVARRYALGSQDGEYVAVAPAGQREPDHLVFLLDPAAVVLRAECPGFEEFLRRYPDALR